MIRVMIGCDPEFVIIKRRKLVPMEQVLKDGRKTKKIGLDMGWKVMELRPDPSEDIFVLIAHIRHLLKHILKHHTGLRNCRFIAGHYACYEALGGHIHISVVDSNESLTTQAFKIYLDTVISGGLMKLINDKKHHATRKANGYGRDYVHDLWHDVFRSKNGVLEYRTPPSWLVSPSLAFMFLGLAKICALLYLNKQPKILPNNIPDIIRVVTGLPWLMKQPDVAKCIELLDNLKRDTDANWINVDFKKTWNL
jgi:hypothetical protein